MSKIIVLNVQNNTTKMYLIENSLKELVILEQKIIDIGIDAFIDSKQKKDYIDYLVNEIGCIDRIKKIIFIVQNEKVIIREYRRICNLKKKDILGYIKFEIGQDMPVDLERYIIKYKILNKEKDSMDLQVILFPKNISDVFLKMAQKLDIKRYSLNINFDILQKFIDLKSINLYMERCFIIESLEEQIILNYIENNKIQSSRIFEKGGSTEYVNTFLSEDINIFYYGKEDLFLNNIISNKKKVDKLKVDLNKKWLWINKIVDNNIQECITEAGVVL